MEWIREWTDSDTHPQMLAAGFWGREVFRCLLRLSGRHDLNGKIPPSMLEPYFLAGYLGVPPVDQEHPEDLVSRGVTACHGAGLLVTDPDGGGGALIPGWETHQERGMTAAERQRKRREKLKMSRSVTEGHEKSRPREEKRREERDKKEATPRDALVALWNETADPEMPRCEGLATQRRRDKADALLKLVPLERWPQLIANANASEFCRGHGPRKWRLSLSKMLKRPELALSTLEGDYGSGEVDGEELVTYGPGEEQLRMVR